MDARGPSLSQRSMGGQRGVTTLLVMVVLASLILGGTVGAWMRVVSTRTSGQAVSTSRAVACAEAGMQAARMALLQNLLTPGAAYVNGVTQGGTTKWQAILATTWNATYNRPFLSGTVQPPLSFVNQPATWTAAPADFKPLLLAPPPAVPEPPAPLTFEATLANNTLEYPTWGGAAVAVSPTHDQDGLFIVSVKCVDPALPYPIVVQRFLRHPDTLSPGAPGGSNAAP